MAKKLKEPTIPELQKSIRMNFKEWEHHRKHGTSDPGYPDGTNMNLVRGHIFIDQANLRRLCKEQGVRPCPAESRQKPPRTVSNDYCAPKSKSRPCVERRRAKGRKRR